MFAKEVILFCAVYITVVHTEPPVPQYGVPFTNNGPGNVGQGGNYQGGYNNGGYNGQYDGQNNHDHSQAMAYEFGYQVKDDYSGNDYGRQEKSDGNQVTGEYRVQLPDGRTQIVTYYADWQTGFHADVRYEGEAQYPNQYNNNGKNGAGTQYSPPVVTGTGANQGSNNYNNNQYDNQNYNPNGGGYNYNPPSNTGYGNVNDGVNFGSYNNFNSNRNKPAPVYGAP